MKETNRVRKNEIKYNIQLTEEQIDIKDSCIKKIKCLEKLDIVNYHTLKSQHRNDDIMKILNFISENNQK